MAVLEAREIALQAEHILFYVGALGLIPDTAWYPKHHRWTQNPEQPLSNVMWSLRTEQKKTKNVALWW